MLVPRVVNASNEAKIFTKEGHEVNKVLSFIIQNVDSIETILFIADPVTDFERTISFRRYLNCKAGFTSLYTHPLIQPNTDNFGKGLIKDFGKAMGGEELNFNNLSDKNLVESIVVFPLLSRKGNEIVTDLGYKINDFTLYRIGSYHIFLRKNPL
jgi:hypothetical protein